MLLEVPERRRDNGVPRNLLSFRPDSETDRFVYVAEPERGVGQDVRQWLPLK